MLGQTSQQFLTIKLTFFITKNFAVSTNGCNFAEETRK